MSEKRSAAKWAALEILDSGAGYGRALTPGHIEFRVKVHTPIIQEAIDTETKPLVEALRRLRNEVKGVMEFEETEMRQLIGNTNYACVQDALGTANAALVPFEEKESKS